MYKTLTYSPAVEGWPSFYSFEPERMIGMNNRFYSFKGGNLWVHNSDEVNRNNFYREQSLSRITGVINESPNDVKTFKTFLLEGTAPWDTKLESDLDVGEVDKTWYALKEGDYYGHIRRYQDNVDFDFRSALGIGNAFEITNVGSLYTITFIFAIDSMISIGDRLFKNTDGYTTLCGTITSISGNTMTVNVTGAVPNGFLLAVKNSVAESYGITGYYLMYTIENNSRDFVELFAIGSNLFKSYP